MQPNVYMIKVVPKKLIIHKSAIYSVHPLNRYRLELLKNSSQYDCMKEWAYAGSHNGVIDFQEAKLQMTVDATARTNFFSLQLVHIQHTLFKDGAPLTSSSKQQPLGKHNLFIKKYLQKFYESNIHFFEEQSHISAHFLLHYHVFIERTQQGLDRIAEEHKWLDVQNRPRKGSVPESIKSSAFSDNINQIEVKGENRFADKANQMMQGPLLGSQTKIEPHFYSPKFPTKIQRATRPSNNTQRQQHSNSKNPVYHNARSRFLPFTERKNPDVKYSDSKNNQKPQPNQEEIMSPPLEAIHLKKLSSEEVKVNFDLFSPDKLKKKVLNQELSNEQKRRRLLEEFDRKQQEFKKKIDSQKLLGNPLHSSISERQFKRSNSTRSMRSVRSVRLRELESLPQEKPWVKKEKEKTKKLYTRIMYIVIVFLTLLLYIVMQPNRKLELSSRSFQSAKDFDTKQKSIKRSKWKRVGRNDAKD